MAVLIENDMFIISPLQEVLVQLKGQLKLGEHYICDLSQCNRDLLYNSERSKDIFFQAVRDSGLTVVSEGFYRFSPHGFTCFLLLAESHASLHAWPEHGYCAIDLFTCNLSMDIQPLVDRLKELFGAGHARILKVDRMADLPNFHLINLEIPGTGVMVHD